MHRLTSQDLFQEALKLIEKEHNQAAILCFHRLLRQHATAEVYANLGVALRKLGKMQAAEAAYRRSLALKPKQAPVISNLGGVLRALGCIEESIQLLYEAIELVPEFAAGHYNLGLALMDARRPTEALSHFEAALALEPERTDARFDRALAILQLGDLREGFKSYECRFQFEKRLNKTFKKPRWDGSRLRNQTLYLYAEQGFGDTLQFIRFVPCIPKSTSKVIIECPKELKRLVSTVSGVDQVVTEGDRVPSFDVHASLFSLPYLFKTDINTIPSHTPYLQAPSTGYRLQQPQGTKYKVGIVWGSGHQDIGLRNRSIALAHFLKLLDVPQIAFYSFQKGPAACDLETLGCLPLIEDAGQHFPDFAGTAYALEQLDLLISADTAIVHLAGALGKPVWVLLPYASEWRWMLDREDSPWYPTMRLFRQESPGNWDELFTRVRSALIEHLPA